MADRIGRAVLEIAIDDKQYRLALDNVNRETDRTADRIRGISQNLDFMVLREFASAAANAVGAIASEVVELGQRGAQVADVRDAFAALTAGVGATSEVMLGALRSGVQGTIADFDLMKTANKALGAGLKLTADDMRTLAAGAKMLADRAGKETAEAFDALTRAMITGRTKGLAEFAFGAKDAGEILGNLRSQLDQAGQVSLDFADYVDKAKVAWQNLRDQLALAIAQSPVLIAGMQAAGQAMDLAFGANSSGLIRVLVLMIQELAISFGHAAQVAIEVGRAVINAFQGVRFFFNSFFEMMFAGVRDAAALLATLAEKASTLPLVGQAFGVIAAGIRQTADTAGALAYGFGDLKLKALDTAAGINAAANSARAIVDATVNAMVAARNAVATNAAQIPPVVAGMRAAQVAYTQEVAAAHAAMIDSQIDDIGRWAAVREADNAIARASAAALHADLVTKQGALRQATEATEAARRNARQQTVEFEMSSNEAIAAGSTQILSVMGRRYKAAAIAGAIISTYQAVAKALASAPPPGSYILAAAALATGLANVAKIRSSQEGFAEGTPGLDFARFGQAMPTFLHGEEAVIPRGGGHILADEIADALVDRAGVEASQATPQAATPVVVPLILEGRKLGEAILQLSRTGMLRIHSSALVTA